MIKINNTNPNYGKVKTPQIRSHQEYREFQQQELQKAFASPEYWQILTKMTGKIFGIRASLVEKSVGADRKIQRTDVPVTITINRIAPAGVNPVTSYTIFGEEDGKIGTVELEEKANGAYIKLVENKKQGKFGGMDKLSDRLAVENCLKRGLKDFEITGDAVWNSHAVHYLAGKRFGNITNICKREFLKSRYGTVNANTIVKQIIELTPQGGRYVTDFLGAVPMYLTKSKINEYVKLAKNFPILK